MRMLLLIRYLLVLPFHYQLNPQDTVCQITFSHFLNFPVSHLLEKHYEIWNCVRSYLKIINNCINNCLHGKLQIVLKNSEMTPRKRLLVTGNLLVTATWRLAFPSSMTSKTSSGLETNLSVAPLTKGTLFLSSCTLRFTLETKIEKLLIVVCFVLMQHHCTYHAYIFTI